jgi:hypothetical protein
MSTPGSALPVAESVTKPVIVPGSGASCTFAVAVCPGATVAVVELALYQVRSAETVYVPAATLLIE